MERLKELRNRATRKTETSRGGKSVFGTGISGGSFAKRAANDRRSAETGTVQRFRKSGKKSLKISRKTRKVFLLFVGAPGFAGGAGFSDGARKEQTVYKAKDNGKLQKNITAKKSLPSDRCSGRKGGIVFSAFTLTGNSPKLLFGWFFFGFISGGGGATGYAVLPPVGGSASLTTCFWGLGAPVGGDCLAAMGASLATCFLSSGFACRRRLPAAIDLRAPPCTRKGQCPLTRFGASRSACFMGFRYALRRGFAGSAR